MPRDTLDIHPSLELDESVELSNESETHWAAKAIICAHIKNELGFEGLVETEKKTCNLIADIRCSSPDPLAGVPEKFVVEVETASSQKDRLTATNKHLKFGYAVYWVFLADAESARRRTETELGDYLPARPSLGFISLSEGEFSMGSAITWDAWERPAPWMGSHEFRLPAHLHGCDSYNHGDFIVCGERITLYKFRGGAMYASWYQDNQQTLPVPAPWSWSEFARQLKAGDIVRASPVRGPP